MVKFNLFIIKYFYTGNITFTKIFTVIINKKKRSTYCEASVSHKKSNRYDNLFTNV